jgi:hypothetical protein
VREYEATDKAVENNLEKPLKRPYRRKEMYNF